MTLKTAMGLKPGQMVEGRVYEKLPSGKLVKRWKRLKFLGVGRDRYVYLKIKGVLVWQSWFSPSNVRMPRSRR